MSPFRASSAFTEEWEHFDFRVDDGIATVTFSRPDKLNALTVEMFRELRRHVVELRDDDGVGCVVLRGAGRCFSAGHDLSSIAEGEEVSGFRSFSQRGVEMHVVLTGSALASVRGQQHAELRPGEYFGELSLIDGLPRSAEVRAGA